MTFSKCNKDLYRAFLQATSVRYSGLALSEVAPSQISHDSVSRWLANKHFSPSEIWLEAKKNINTDIPCLLICDDSILDKSRSEEIELVHYQYSGNVHDIVAGIGLVNLLHYCLETRQAIPVDYKIYDKDTDGKTKNDHFRDMLSIALKRGLRPYAVVVDTWYSSLDNLKAIRSHNLFWVAGLRKNRKVNRDESLGTLDIPPNGLKLHLRGYGWITVFRFEAKNGRTDYIGTNIEAPTRNQVENIMKARWSIEVYHRELKQTCGIERCQARTARAQRNHIFLAISAWFAQRSRRSLNTEISIYRQHWEVLKKAIAGEINYILSTA